MSLVLQEHIQTTHNTWSRVFDITNLTVTQRRQMMALLDINDFIIDDLTAVRPPSGLDGVAEEERKALCL